MLKEFTLEEFKRLRQRLASQGIGSPSIWAWIDLTGGGETSVKVVDEHCTHYELSAGCWKLTFVDLAEKITNIQLWNGEEPVFYSEEE